MRTILAPIVACAMLVGCQQTNPGNAKGAAGAAIGVEAAPVAPAPAEPTAVAKPVIKFEHTIKSPRDVATGQATGKRQH